MKNSFRKWKLFFMQRRCLVAMQSTTQEIVSRETHMLVVQAIYFYQAQNLASLFFCEKKKKLYKYFSAGNKWFFVRCRFAKKKVKIIFFFCLQEVFHQMRNFLLLFIVRNGKLLHYFLHSTGCFLVKVILANVNKVQWTFLQTSPVTSIPQLQTDVYAKMFSDKFMIYLKCLTAECDWNEIYMKTLKISFSKGNFLLESKKCLQKSMIFFWFMCVVFSWNPHQQQL